MEIDRQNTDRTCRYCTFRVLNALEKMDCLQGYRNAVSQAFGQIKCRVYGVTDGCVAIVKDRGDALIADLEDANMPEIHLAEVRHWLGVLASDMPDAEVDGNTGGMVSNNENRAAGMHNEELKLRSERSERR